MAGNERVRVLRIGVDGTDGLEELPRSGRDLRHGLLECLRIALRRGAIAADLANELERGGVDLIERDGIVSASQDLDGTAHGSAGLLVACVGADLLERLARLLHMEDVVAGEQLERQFVRLRTALLVDPIARAFLDRRPPPQLEVRGTEGL